MMMRACAYRAGPGFGVLNNHEAGAGAGAGYFSTAGRPGLRPGAGLAPARRRPAGLRADPSPPPRAPRGDPKRGTLARGQC